MVAYREPDGLEKTAMVLASLAHEVKLEASRRWVLWFQIAFFAIVFLILVGGETLFATMMFSIIQIEILGTTFSGAAFALMVPTVIGYAHVRLHYEADHFLRWWLKRLSGIGVPIFALGVSLMIGYSAWEAAQEALDMTGSAPTGTLGTQTVGGTDLNASPSIANWIGVVPSSLLFLGLSFGMIIAISFASFCMGRVLLAFNILTQTPSIGDEIKTLLTAANGKIAAFRKMRDHDEAARRKLPFDVKVKFAREAAHAGWKTGQAKIAAARRVFHPVAKNDPLMAIVGDPVAGTIPTHFKSEKEFARHMADQMDSMRAHNVMRVLVGIPDTGKESK